MLFLSRCYFPVKDVTLFCKFMKPEVQMLSYLNNQHISEKFKINSPEEAVFHIPLSRFLHQTKINNDIGEGIGKIGAGLAGISVGLAGIGTGIAAGNAAQGYARNPSKHGFLIFILSCSFIEGLGLCSAALSLLISY